MWAVQGGWLILSVGIDSAVFRPLVRLTWFLFTWVSFEQLFTSPWHLNICKSVGFFLKAWLWCSGEHKSKKEPGAGFWLHSWKPPLTLGALSQELDAEICSLYYVELSSMCHLLNVPQSGELGKTNISLFLVFKLLQVHSYHLAPFGVWLGQGGKTKNKQFNQ